MISNAAERSGREAANPSKLKSRRIRPGIWIAVGLVFGVQIAALFWLGNPPPVQHLHPTAAPKFILVTNGWNELLALQDPTLFALPHRNNFSGAAWLKIPPQDFQPTNRSEPTQPLQLSREELGATFAAFMQSNPPPRIQMDIAAGLGMIDLVDLPLPPPQSIVTASTVRVEGDLKKRRLLEPLQLPPQPSADVLQNTEVQLFVDALGNTFSPVIVAKSGNDNVDAMVLTNFAKNARFEPLKANELGTAPAEIMTFGKLIFEWQTVPLAQTNAPTSNL
jgi:hypothetical protein